MPPEDYRSESDSPPFDLPKLERALTETVHAGKLHHTPVTDSTNTDALNAGRAGAPDGSVYFADEQLLGRGRGNHGWHSPAGQGLYVSVLLRPEWAARRLPLLPLAAGLAAAEALRSTAGLNVDLRWPNDLLIGPRKLGGILVEAKTEGDQVAFAVVGIGINVHQTHFDPGLSTTGTSLALESNRALTRQALLVELLLALAKETQALLDPATAASIPARLEAASTWVCGRHVEVHGPQACTGVTEGLDANGFLRVRTATGVITVQTGGIRDSSQRASADLSHSADIS
jgi:BirA family transcriptional regulator, biotin operon repressor / biotin---[acetyl-CoA-carboxylase] ligase